MEFPKLKGLMAATFTPFHDDESLNLDIVPEYVNHLCEQGIVGIYVAGSTGEGLLLTEEERKRVVEAYTSEAKGRMKVIVNVGHDSPRVARMLAEQAAEVGADAISALPPIYDRPANLKALVDTLALICEGAPHLPFFYYHIPHRTGQAHSMPELMERAAEAIPSFAGLKYTSTAIHDLVTALDICRDGMQIFYGTDEMMLQGLVAGTKACVGSTYNFGAPIYRQLLDAFNKGDLATARARQRDAVRMINILVPHGMAGLKAGLNLAGVNVGPTRLPHGKLSQEALKTIRAGLEEVGFFEWSLSTAPTA